PRGCEGNSASAPDALPRRGLSRKASSIASARSEPASSAGSLLCASPAYHPHARRAVDELTRSCMRSSRRCACCFQDNGPRRSPPASIQLPPPHRTATTAGTLRDAKSECTKVEDCLPEPAREHQHLRA